jgi:hypothetical protein
LKTKMSFPKSAFLSEFGWEPINEFLDWQRVNYFARFDELPAHRLCKIVFMELKNSECVEWKYVNYMKNIVQSLGLDHYHYGNFNTNIFNIFSVKQFKIRNYLRYWKWAVYQSITYLIFHQGNKHIYACSIDDFWASRLKFLARTNYFPFNERLFKINLRESSKCSICDDDMVEDLHHFLFECKTLRAIRQELFGEMETVINKIVLSGSRVFRATALSKAAVLDRRLLS